MNSATVSSYFPSILLLHPPPLSNSLFLYLAGFPGPSSSLRWHFPLFSYPSSAFRVSPFPFCHAGRIHGASQRHRFPADKSATAITRNENRCTNSRDRDLRVFCGRAVEDPILYLPRILVSFKHMVQKKKKTQH